MDIKQLFNLDTRILLGHFYSWLMAEILIVLYMDIVEYTSDITRTGTIQALGNNCLNAVMKRIIVVSISLPEPTMTCCQLGPLGTN